jgi:hypothetical protein
MELTLSSVALQLLMKPVHGKGGCQQLLRKLQTQVSGPVLTLSEGDLEMLERYSHSYGLGGFRIARNHPRLKCSSCCRTSSLNPELRRPMWRPKNGSATCQPQD